MRTRVINGDGRPLMPSNKPGMVRHMLKSGKAKIISYFPFTIKLNYVIEHPYTQPIRVGADMGQKFCGISVTTETKELSAYEFRHRSSDVKDNLGERHADRQGRRHRKTRYRKERIKNRAKPDGWIPPSAQHMVESHVKDIEIATRFLPTPESITIETGRFNTQKMDEPDIEGEMYQQGTLTGFDNVKAFVRWRDGNVCQNCHGKSGDKKIEVHHIKRRADDGSNRPANLVCLCHTCHVKHHNDEIKLKKFNLGLKSADSLRAAAAMNITADRVIEEVKAKFPHTKAKKTYGYVTSFHRNQNNIEKTHANDARVISGNFNVAPEEQIVIVKRLRRHNRQIHKKNFMKGGIRRMNQSAHFVKGFALNDYVIVDGDKKGVIVAKMSTGYAIVKTIDGERVHEKTVVSMKRLKLIRRSTNIIYDFKDIKKCS